MDTLRAARKQTQLRNARRRAQRRVERKEDVLDRFAAQDQSGLPYRRPCGLSQQLKRAYGDYEYSLERYNEAEAILDQWQEQLQYDLRVHLRQLDLGAIIDQPSEIQLRSDGSTHVYYSTTGKSPKEFDHGHANVTYMAKLAFLRTPGSRREREVNEAALVS